MNLAHIIGKLATVLNALLLEIEYSTFGKNCFCFRSFETPLLTKTVQVWTDEKLLYIIVQPISSTASILSRK